MALRPFSDYAAGIATADLPDEALHAAKRCLIDWFVSVLPGGLQPLATLLILAYADPIGSRGGSGGAGLYPSGQRTDPRTVNLINGAAVHTIEFDEIYRDFLYHLGAPVISAASVDNRD
jgi:2-methylcitrate dehydratase PrpD